MSSKVTVEVTFSMSININEGVALSRIMDELDYEFRETTTQATLENTEMLDYEIKDSR